MCSLIVGLESNHTPRFLTLEEGDISTQTTLISLIHTLASYCFVTTRRNPVLSSLSFNLSLGIQDLIAGLQSLIAERVFSWLSISFGENEI